MGHRRLSARPGTESARRGARPMSPLIFERSVLLVGIAGILMSAVGWVLTPLSFAHAWLAALTLWLSWPLGSLALLLIHALTGGRWGFAIRRPLLAGAA